MTRQEALALPRLAKLRVQDFFLLEEAGAFEQYARTELIDGEIWVVNAIHSRHARAHAQLTGELWVASKGLGLPLTLYNSPSTQLSSDSLPEPDIALADPDDARILSGAKLRLAIEISDSTLEMDMGRKLRLYAAHAIPEYWVIDLEGRRIHQMWAPEGEGYSECGELAFGERIGAATIKGLYVPTDAL